MEDRAEAPEGSPVADIDTHHAFVNFGKFAGERVTRLPVSYLKWAASTGVDRPIVTRTGEFPFAAVARAELVRRGERLDTIDLSAHAIDRLSVRFLDRYLESRRTDEGLYAWAQRLAEEAWQNKSILDGKDGTWSIEYGGVVWIIEELAIPVVKTVK